MGRLVDIDDVKALIDDIYERDKDIINMDYKRNAIKDRIDELDTACDEKKYLETYNRGIDDCIEELKKRRDTLYMKVNCDDVELKILSEKLKVIYPGTAEPKSKITKTLETMMSMDEVKVRYPIGSKTHIDGKEYMKIFVS